MEEIKEPKLVEHLFEGWQETLIWSCLQQVMGQLYANDANHPTAAMALIGDFCFFAGEPDKELVLFRPELDKRNFIIMVPQTEAWSELIASCSCVSPRFSLYFATLIPTLFSSVI